MILASASRLRSLAVTASRTATRSLSLIAHRYHYARLGLPAHYAALAVLRWMLHDRED
jgi:hypothetical protein